MEETLHRRPKLLFLARSFPPLRAISCVRTWNIAKYLARLEWDVTVVTPHPSLWRLVENFEETNFNLKREGIRRILTTHRCRCLVPNHFKCRNHGLGWLVGGICRRIARRLDLDSGIGWIRAAEQACSSLTAKDVDVILATGSPFAAFQLAKRLSDRLGRPYVLDYRDPWSGNPYTARPVLRSTIQKEARILADCAAVTIVSNSWSLAMHRRFGLGAKLHVVTNGYDPEELTGVDPYDFGHFAIVYTGNFYPPKRVISPVMAAIKRLKQTTVGQNTTWYFHYYGKQENHVREEANRFGVMDRVLLHGSVPRSEVFAALQGAGVAVVILSVSEESTVEDRGMVPAKVYEPLGLRTPILLIAPQGKSDVEVIVESTGLGRRFTGSDIDGMVSFFADSMRDQASDLRDYEAYAWPNIVRQLDSILRTVVKQDQQDGCTITGLKCDS